MKRRLHLEGAACFERALEELDILADHELAIWACMHAGTHYLNAALHGLAITVENDLYPIDGVSLYFKPDGRGGGHKETAPPGDIIHTTMPRLPAWPPELQEAYAAQAEIEAMRPLHVRGVEPFGPREADRLRTCMRTVRDVCRPYAEVRS